MRISIALALLLSPALARAQDVSELDELLRERPHDVQLRLDRADALLGLGRFDEALVDCDLAAAIAPKDPAIALTRGHIHLAMGELGLAEEQLTLYIESGEPTTEVFLLRGGIREETERFREALADFDAARALVTNLPKQRRTYAELLELIEIEESRARALDRLDRKKEAQVAREHAKHLQSLTRTRRPPRDT